MSTLYIRTRSKLPNESFASAIAALRALQNLTQSLERRSARTRVSDGEFGSEIL